IFITLLVAAVTFAVVFVERGQRKILVNYAKRQVGNKVYGGQSSHLPLKLNMSGVIPPIFASSIILLPTTAVSWFATGDSLRWLPEFLVLKYNVPFYFGGTSLLIIVVVTMDFWAQVQSYVMSQQYESLLKKANFKAG